MTATVITTLDDAALVRVQGAFGGARLVARGMDGRWRCTCLRGACKHVRLAVAALEHARQP
jgi:hypothetical protein